MLGETALQELLLAAPVRPPPTGDPKGGVAHAALDLRRAERMIRTGQVGQAEALTRQRSKHSRSPGRIEAQPSLPARSPTFWRPAATSTRPCASGGRKKSRSTSASATCARARSRWARSPTFFRPAATSTRPCASGGRKKSRSTSASATCARARSRWARSPTFFRPAATSTRPCASGGRSSCRSTSASATCARARSRNRRFFKRLGDLRSRAVRSNCRSTSASATCARARSRWARSPTFFRPAATSTRPCASGGRKKLPVYERLGDVRSRAVTMGQIADVLQVRGDLDEALRIRREEESPGLRAPRRRALALGHLAKDCFRSS